MFDDGDALKANPGHVVKLLLEVDDLLERGGSLLFNEGRAEENEGLGGRGG